jgi:Rab proteins geranylgeranyltransferase component A
VLRDGELHKIPSTREDVFSDDILTVKDKRSLMKFLRFVLQDADESANQPNPDQQQSLLETLEHFKVPTALHTPVLALALSQQPANAIESSTAIARIRRHLQSVGYFGQGFGAVVAKYGGISEVAQVACRAQAVGGGVYLLGHGIELAESPLLDNEPDPKDEPLVNVQLNDGTKLKARSVVGGTGDLPANGEEEAAETKHTLNLIAVLSGPLKVLFPPTSDNGPVPAAAIIMVETEGGPIYLQVHSEDTGECPAGQCESILPCLYMSKDEQLQTYLHCLRHLPLLIHNL